MNDLPPEIVPEIPEMPPIPLSDMPQDVEMNDFAEQPAAIDEQPAAIDEQPAAVDEPPRAVDDRQVALAGQPAAFSEPPRDFEEFTLAEAFSLVLRRPIPTLAALFAVARAPRNTDLTVLYLGAQNEPISDAAPTAVHEVTAPHSPVDEISPMIDTSAAAVPPVSAYRPIASSTLEVPALTAAHDLNAAPDQPTAQPPSDISAPVRWARLLGRGLALVIAFIGSAMLIGAPVRDDLDFIDNGLAPVLVAMVVWALAEMLPLMARITNRGERVISNPSVAPFRCDDGRFIPLTIGRGLAVAIAAVAGYQAYEMSQGNRFTTPGVLAWALAIFAAMWALAPIGWSPLVLAGNIGKAARAWRPRVTLAGVALLAIMAGGAVLRFVDLDTAPPEMTSDHVEKLLDVSRLLQGDTNVFFGNNGGRDPLHFYFLAGLATLSGAELNFWLLKAASAIEGVITIAAMYWMGREVIGKRDRALAEVVGLLLAALVATSAWHLFLSRLGLRIVLTPLFTALFIGFLARALRYNRRWDFIYAGLVLGAGLYGYQALRMLPILAVVGGFFGMVVGARTWRVRLTLAANMVALALIAAVVFIPLYRYSVDYTDEFWSRSSGRLFGDDLTQETLPDGTVVRRAATLQERSDAFAANLPNLITNTRNALLMFHWRGDVAWFHNPPNRPAFDAISGALLVAGVIAALARAARRADPVDWLMVPGILVMMLPSILSLAFPIENPSHTRISGALPGVYFIMALALGVLVLELSRLAGRPGRVIARVGIAGVFGLISASSVNVHFNEYRTSYLNSALPYSEAGQTLRQFAAAEGHGYGNAFMLAYPYWWDHRALGISGGSLTWNNTILKAEEIPQAVRDAAQRAKDDRNRFDSSQPILFFLSIDDEAGRNWLTEQFPDATRTSIISYNQRPYDLIEVPAQSISQLNQLIVEAGLEPLADS